MGFTTVVNMSENKNYTPKQYVRYTTPTDEDGEERELKDTELKLKKNDSLEGYYVGSHTRDTPHGVKYNHVIQNKENKQFVIPDNKDITKAFLSDRMIKGALTRFTYLGKQSFEFTDDKGKVGKASAAKALIEQNADDTVTFEGEQGCELIAGIAAPIVAKKEYDVSTDANFTSDEIPF